MSTHAQIAIHARPESWVHVYVHFDCSQAPMLPALARWRPEDIIVAKEIRQVAPEALNCFSPPHDPRILPRTKREFVHLYLWAEGQWVTVLPLADSDTPRAARYGKQSERTDIARNFRH